MTASSATTGIRWARCRRSRRTTSSTAGRRARPWRRRCAWAGWRCRPGCSTRWWRRRGWPAAPRTRSASSPSPNSSLPAATIARYGTPGSPTAAAATSLSPRSATAPTGFASPESPRACTRWCRSDPGRVRPRRSPPRCAATSPSRAWLTTRPGSPRPAWWSATPARRSMPSPPRLPRCGPLCTITEVMNGYPPRQADERLAQLSAELRRYQKEALAARRELAEAHRRIRELESPASARIEQLLQAAREQVENEAAKARTQAERETGELRHAAEREADRARKAVTQQAEQVISAAEQAAAKVIAAAERTAAELRAAAERAATELRAAAEQEVSQRRAAAERDITKQRAL